MFVKMVRTKIGTSKPIVVTESGWPHGGQPNGKAIPGLAQQQAAIASLKAALPSNLILYSGYNEHWLVNNAYTFGAQNHWGVYGDSPGGI